MKTGKTLLFHPYKNWPTFIGLIKNKTAVLNRIQTERERGKEIKKKNSDTVLQVSSPSP